MTSTITISGARGGQGARPSPPPLPGSPPATTAPPWSVTSPMLQQPSWAFLGRCTATPPKPPQTSRSQRTPAPAPRSPWSTSHRRLRRSPTIPAAGTVLRGPCYVALASPPGGS